MKKIIVLLSTLSFIAFPAYTLAADKKESVSITKDRDGWRADYSDRKHTDYHPKGNTYNEVKEVYTSQGVKVESGRGAPGGAVQR